MYRDDQKSCDDNNDNNDCSDDDSNKNHHNTEIKTDSHSFAPFLMVYQMLKAILSSAMQK